MERNVELFREYCYPHGPYGFGISPDGHSEPVTHGVDFCEYARNYIDNFQEIPQSGHIDSCHVCLTNQRMVEAVTSGWQRLPDSQAAGLVEQMAKVFVRRDSVQDVPEYRGFCASLANNPELLYLFRTLIDAESAPKVEPPPGFVDRTKGYVAGYIAGLEDRE